MLQLFDQEEAKRATSQIPGQERRLPTRRYHMRSSAAGHRRRPDHPYRAGQAPLLNSRRHLLDNEPLERDKAFPVAVHRMSPTSIASDIGIRCRRGQKQRKSFPTRNVCNARRETSRWINYLQGHQLECAMRSNSRIIHRKQRIGATRTTKFRRAGAGKIRCSDLTLDSQTLVVWRRGICQILAQIRSRLAAISGTTRMRIVNTARERSRRLRGDDPAAERVDKAALGSAKICRRRHARLGA